MEKDTTPEEIDMTPAFTRILFATGVLCTLFAGLARGADETSAGSPASVLADTAPSDLALDTTFGPGGRGWNWYDLVDSTAMNSDDQVMRVFPVDEVVGSPPQFQTFYYLLGKHLNVPSDGSAWTRDAIVLKVDQFGSRVTDFGVDGMVRIPLGARWEDVLDAAMMPGQAGMSPSRVYFAGKVRWPGTDLNMGVACFDLDDGGICDNFGILGTALFPFDLGGTNDDAATRIEYDPAGFLFASGYADAPLGKQVAVVKMSADTGATSGDFGVSGMLNYDLGTGGARDNNVYASMLTSATSPGGRRLVLGGNYKTAAGDYDAYVMSLSPAGASPPRIGRIAHESDNSGAKSDAVTALGVTHRGKILYAGWSETDSVTYDAVIWSALDSVAMTYDPNVCGGGSCVEAPGTPLTNGDRDSWPYAIIERPGNYDVVIAMQARTRLTTVLPPPPYTFKQIVRQYGASGGTWHATQYLEFPAASGQTPGAYMRSAVLDGNRVLVAGLRYWNTFNGVGDYDLTLARLVPLDSIFSSHFGATNGD